MIPVQRVDAGRGVAWVGDGFRIFGASPGLWIVITLIVTVIFFVCAAIPVVGSIALCLLAPLLGAGMMFAAREADAKRPIEVGQLFAGFKDSRAVNGLLALGGVLIVGLIASSLVGFLLLSNFFMAALQGAVTLIVYDTGTFIGLSIVLMIQLAVMGAVAYAVPLIAFKKVSVREAMSASINACLVNFLALLVFSIIYLVLTTVLSVPFIIFSFISALPFLLLWLVLLPASAGMLYVSYRDIFGG